MMIFETERMCIRSITNADNIAFAKLCNDEEVRRLVPQEAFSDEEVESKFKNWKNLDDQILTRERSVYGCYEKGSDDLIGLCLFLTNDENDPELGYRFLASYWGKGLGTEVAKGIIDFSFEKLNRNKITADAAVQNIGSIKILQKFMSPVRDFFNERDNCMDRRFELYKSDWQ